MAIVKIHKKESPYVQIDKAGIEDKNLSWGATGLLTYLIGRPDNWSINITHLSTVKTDKRDSTRNYLNELRKFNYCHYFEFRKGGKITDTTYLIFETPTSPEVAQELIEAPEGEKIFYKPIKSTTNSKLSPKTDLPETVSPFTEKQPLIIIDNNNIDINNKDLNKTCDMSSEKKLNRKGFPVKDKWEEFLIDNLPGIDYQNKIQKAIAKLEKTWSQNEIEKYLLETYTLGLQQNLSLEAIAKILSKNNRVSTKKPSPKVSKNLKNETKIDKSVVNPTKNEIKSEKSDTEIILTKELSLKAIEILTKEKGIDESFLSETKNKNIVMYENMLRTALKDVV